MVEFMSQIRLHVHLFLHPRPHPRPLQCRREAPMHTMHRSMGNEFGRHLTMRKTLRTRSSAWIIASSKNCFVKLL